MYVNVLKLREYETQINKVFGASVVKYNAPRQTGYNLPSLTGRVEGGVEGFSVIMRKVFGNKVKVEKVTGELATKISGKYNSFAVTISSTEGFYFRSVVGDRGSLTDKDLTPTKLNLGGKTLSKNNFDEVIEAGLINNSDLPLEVLNLGYELLYLCKGKGLTVRTNSDIQKLIGSISSTDLKKFGKNFGEVLIAQWCLYNKPNAASIFFPKEENTPLADFVVNYTPTTKRSPLNVSAKFEGGANASLNSIIQADSKVPEGATEKEIKAFNAIMAVSYDKVIDGLLNAEKILETPEYKKIKTMIGGIVTQESISKLVETALLSANITINTKWDVTNKTCKDKYTSFMNKLEPIFSLVGGGRPDIKVIPKIAALGKGNFHHPIYYAFSVALARRFNSNIEFSSILDKAATSIKAEQIYININEQNVNIKVKEFSKSKFEFSAGAFSYSADNVRMKVKMLK